MNQLMTNRTVKLIKLLHWCTLVVDCTLGAGEESGILTHIPGVLDLASQLKIL